MYKYALTFTLLIIVSVYIGFSSTATTKSLNTSVESTKKSVTYTPYSFDSNKSATYSLKLIQNSTIFNDTNPMEYKFVINANLHTRVLKAETSSFYIAYQLSDFKLHNSTLSKEYLQQLYPYYTSMYLVKMDYFGRLEKIYFPGKKINFLGLLQLTKLLEVINKKELNYLLEQKDSLGRYRAFYTKEKSIIKKQKTNYIQMDEAYKENSVDINNSIINAVVDKNGSWLKELELKESLTLYDSEQKKFAINNNSLLLSKLSDKPNMKLQVYLENRSIETILKDFNKLKNIDVDIYQKLYNQAQKKRFQNLHTTIDSLVNRLSSPSSFRELQEYLTLYPDSTFKLQKHINTLKDDITMKIISILETVGSKQAQELLVYLTKDTDTLQINKIRSLIALGGTKELSKSSRDTLYNVSLIRGNETLNELSDTSLLALATHPNDDVVSHIKSLYSSSPSLSREKNLLYSMQNAGAENFIDEIVHSSMSQSTKVRSLAVVTLSNIDDKELRESLLLNQLNIQTDKQIKQLIETLLKK